MSRRKTLLFSGLSTLLLLAALEFTLRFALNLSSLPHAASDLIGPAPEENERFEYVIEDDLLGWALRPGSYRQGGISINSKGWRTPEFQWRKTPGIPRLLTLGDSCTFGGESVNGSYPDQLRLLWTTRPDLPQIEIVNAGVEGYNSKHLPLLLQTKLKNLEFDIALILIGWNDLYTRPADRPHLADWSTAIPGQRWPRLFHSFFLIKGLRRLIFLEWPRWQLKIFGPPDAARTRKKQIHPLTTESFEAQVAHTIALIRQRGAQPVLLNLASVIGQHNSDEVYQRAHYPFYLGADPQGLYQIIQTYNRALRELSQRLNVPLIDLFAHLDRLTAVDKLALFSDAIHLNPRGYRLWAEHILHALVKSHPIQSRLVKSPPNE